MNAPVVRFPHQQQSTQLARPQSAEPSMPIVLVDWRPLRKGSLVGFAKILLGRSLMISNVTVNVSNGKAWAALPSKPVIVDGKHALNPTTGRPAYKPDMEWASDSARRRFSDSVVDAIRAHHPEAFSDGVGS
jgi:hypothetical protein